MHIYTDFTSFTVLYTIQDIERISEFGSDRFIHVVWEGVGIVAPFYNFRGEISLAC